MKWVNQFNEYEEWLRINHPWLYYLMGSVIVMLGIIVVTFLFVGLS